MEPLLRIAVLRAVNVPADFIWGISQAGLNPANLCIRNIFQNKMGIKPGVIAFPGGPIKPKVSNIELEGLYLGLKYKCYLLL